MEFGFLARFLNVLNPRPRAALSFGAAALALLCLPNFPVGMRLLVSWSTGVFCYLTLVGLMMSISSPESTRKRAQRQEADHLSISLMVVFVAFTSLFAIAAVLANHKDTFSLATGLAIVAIVASWLLMHTMFALHYASFFYCQDGSEAGYIGGLEFSETDQPDYWDFIYFTFTLGMTSQTSDTAIVSSAMRRLALGHTVVSFFFYSVILALTVSIVSGLI